MRVRANTGPLTSHSDAVDELTEAATNGFAFCGCYGRSVRLPTTASHFPDQRRDSRADSRQLRAQGAEDRRDAVHYLNLLMGGRFPRLWVPDAEVRDLRQLLIHFQCRSLIWQANAA